MFDPLFLFDMIFGKLSDRGFLQNGVDTALQFQKQRPRRAGAGVLADVRVAPDAVDHIRAALQRAQHLEHADVHRLPRQEIPAAFAARGPDDAGLF